MNGRIAPESRPIDHGMNREKLALSVKHHGLARTGLVYTLKAFRRLIDFDLMRVESSSGRATGPIADKPYVTRQIMADEYCEGVQWLAQKRLW